MQQIPLDKIKAGMVLARELKRHDGVLLAKQGTEITAGLINMLKRMNVDFITIEKEEQLSPEEKIELLKSELEKLDNRFSKVKNNVILIALRQTIAKRLKKEILGDPLKSEEIN